MARPQGVWLLLHMGNYAHERTILMSLVDTHMIIISSVTPRMSIRYVYLGVLVYFMCTGTTTHTLRVSATTEASMVVLRPGSVCETYLVPFVRLQFAYR